MHRGWIKLWRKTLDSQIWANPVTLKVWIWCLLSASSKRRWVTVTVGRGKREVELQPGEFLYGRHRAAAELDLPPGTVRNQMAKLAEIGCLDSKVDSNGTIVSICNWELYNSPPDEDGQQSGQPMDNQWTTKGQPMDNQRTAVGQPMDNQWTTNGHKQEYREGKERENGRMEETPPQSPPRGGLAFDVFWEAVHVKTAKEDARKAHTKAVKKVARERKISPQEAAAFILERMKAFAASPKAHPEDHSPVHPSTWLNGGRYDDDPSAWYPNVRRGPRPPTQEEMDNWMP